MSETRQGFRPPLDHLESAEEEYRRATKAVRQYVGVVHPSKDAEWKRVLQRAAKAKELYNIARRRNGMKPIRP